MLVFNANTQREEEVAWSTDANGEIICTFPDQHFLKFPAGVTQAEIVSLLEKHKQENEGNEVITPEMEAAKQAQMQASQSLVGQLNDTPQTDPTINNGNSMPDGSQNNAPANPQNQAQPQA